MKRMTKYILGMILLLLVLSLPTDTTASQTGYNIYLPFIFKHGEIFLDIGNRDESLAFYKSNYILSSTPVIDWTGSHASCDPGTTNPGFQDAELTRINYFRAMAGVPLMIEFSEESNLKAQAAALMMSVNNELNHYPPETWTCYSTLGYEGAGSSNLFLGIHGWEAISGYIRDAGPPNDTVGHRRWLLYPQTRTMGSGDIPTTGSYPSSNALVVYDENLGATRPDTRDGYVAWPPPGYVPYPVVFTRWSFSYPDADFSQAVVQMSKNGVPLSIIKASVQDGFGENTVVWQLEGMDSGTNWPAPNQDTSYEILIENININDQDQSFSYEVIIFDPNIQ